jgi:hypothetical protein
MSFTNTGIPLLKKEDQLCLRKAIQENLGNLVFRRVGKVVQKGVYEVRKFDFDSETKAETFEIHERYPHDQKELHQKWEIRCEHFYGFTEKRSLRSDGIDSEIHFRSENYAELDIVGNCSFTFNKTKNQRVRPLVGDLICGIVSTSSKFKKSKPVYTHWFNCSEQFLRAWTLIMYDTHDSFNGKTGNKLKQFMLSGNRLNSNSFLKWIMAHHDNNIELPLDETKKRFYHQRTEFVSWKWVHVYAALFSMVCHGELPCEFNVPNNNNDDPKMTHWNLPGKFITTLLTTYTKANPSEWNHKNWSFIETMARKWSTPKVPEVESLPLLRINSEEDFPGIQKANSVVKPPQTVEWVKVVQKNLEPKKEVETKLLEETSRSSSSSWADMAEEDDDEDFSDFIFDREPSQVEDSDSQKSSNPSEGEHKSKICLLIIKSKTDGKVKTKLYETDDKARQWVFGNNLKLMETCHETEQVQKHDGTFKNCEICQLRKFKMEMELKNYKISPEKYIAFDGTKFNFKHKSVH